MSWKSVDTTALYPASIREIGQAVDAVNTTVNSIMAALAQVESLLTFVDTLDPRYAAARASLLVARQALVELSAGHTGAHYLNVPISRVDGSRTLVRRSFITSEDTRAFRGLLGSGGNLGFFNTVSNSVNDAADSGRPQYGRDDYVAGLVLMVGSTSPIEALNNIRMMMRMLGDAGIGMDANTLVHPTGLRAQRLPQGTLLTWDGVFPLAKPERLLAAINIRQVVIYRSTEPFSARTPPGKLKTYEIGRQVYNPVKPMFLDTEAAPSQEYYYAIGYIEELIDTYGASLVREDAHLSSVLRLPPVRNGSPVVVFSHGTPPDWGSVQSFVALFPAIQHAIEAMVGYIDILIAMTRPNTALSQVIAGLRETILQKQKMITRILALLDEIYHTFLPTAGVYAMSFTGKGGTDFFLRSLLSGLTDTSDIHRPPFDTGKELVAGCVLLGGAGSAAGLKGIQTLCSFFTK